MNKQRNRIYIERLFPNVSELKLHHKLKINKESIMYITIPNDAEQITNIIANHVLKFFQKCSDVNIIDATAGVGGNTISFSDKFKHVIAIEIDQERFNYLLNNVSVYHMINVTLYNNDCMKIIPNLTDNDVIFIDPPWGGKSYKSHNKIRLTLGDDSIEDICLQLLDCNKMKIIPRLIVLKLPKNYDLQYIYNKVKINNLMDCIKIYFYELNKMILIVIENGHYSLPSSSNLL